MPSFWSPLTTTTNTNYIKDHGDEQLNILLNEWGELIDKDMIKSEFQMLKLELIEAARSNKSFLNFWNPVWKSNRAISSDNDSKSDSDDDIDILQNINRNNNNNSNNSPSEMCSNSITLDGLQFPNISKLCMCAGSVSHTSTGPERGYATLNNIKSNKRNTLMLTTLSNCMHGALNGPEYYEEFDFEQAYDNFENKKTTRGRYKLKPTQSISKHPIKPNISK